MTIDRWTVVLSDLAQRDFREITGSTARRFGRTQADRYVGLVNSTPRRLSSGPYDLLSTPRADLGDDFRAQHVPRPGRHVVLYCPAADRPNVVEVLRILHDAMDFRQHLPSSEL